MQGRRKIPKLIALPTLNGEMRQFTSSFVQKESRKKCTFHSRILWKYIYACVWTLEHGTRDLQNSRKILVTVSGSNINGKNQFPALRSRALIDIWILISLMVPDLNRWNFMYFFQTRILSFDLNFRHSFQLNKTQTGIIFLSKHLNMDIRLGTRHRLFIWVKILPWLILKKWSDLSNSLS